MNGKNLILSLLGALFVVTVSWAQNITPLGQYDYWYTANDVTKSGSYAYVVGEGATGLRIVDVSNPAAPVEVGYCPAVENGYSVSVNGNIAYVTGYYHLYVVDVTNPTAPQILGEYTSSSYYLYKAVMSYPHVFISTWWSNSVFCVDVSNPVTPVVVDTLATSGPTLGLAIADSRLYIADGEMGLHIYDISNPTSPTWVGYYRTPNFAREVTVQGSLAYVLDGLDEYIPSAGLMIIDVTDPVQPTLLSSYGAYVRSGEIEVGGGYAYIAGYSYYGAHLRIVDVSNPLDPQEVCSYLHDGNSSTVCLTGSQLYLAGDGITILDVTNPPTPVWVSQYYPGYGGREMVVQGDYAYAVNYYHGGLDVLDISDPAYPQWLSFCHTPDYPRNIVLRYPYAYLADQAEGLRIINVSDPNHPVEAAYYDPVSPNLNVTEVALDSTYAYLAGGSGGLQVLDISAPLNPVPVGLITNIQPFLIKVSGSYAYTAEASASPFDGMRIFSLADPAHPVQIGSVTFTGTVQDMDVEGSYAYVTTSSTLLIFNVSNPALPTQIYSSTAWEGYSLDVVGSRLFVVKSDLYVLNVAYPASPSQAGFYDLSYTGRGVTVVDSIAYVGRDYYFNTFDCSDCWGVVTVTLEPLNPPITIPAIGGSFYYTLAIANSYPQLETIDLWTMVRLPNQTWYGPMLELLNLTLPPGSSFSRLRLQNVPGNAPAGNYLYEARIGDYPGQITDADTFSFTKLGSSSLSAEASDWICSGELFPCETSVHSMPSDFQLCHVSPNPFNPTTVIRYQMPEARHVSLKVYDTAGRLVTTLVDGWREAGTHEVTFDGKGLASGIYLYTLFTGQNHVTGKMVLMK